MIALLHKSSGDHPWFEVLGAVDKGRKLEVRPVWGNREQQSLIYTVDKAAMREYGYYPKEIDDALKPELCARL